MDLPEVNPREEGEAILEEGVASEGRDLPSLLRSDYPLSPENLPRAPDPPPSLDQLPVGSRLGACLPAWR